MDPQFRLRQAEGGVLVMKGSDEEVAAQAKLKAETDPLVVAGSLALNPASRAALAEYSIWLTVQRDVTSKRLDPWTSQYVAGRLHDAREVVGSLVLSELLPGDERPGPQYWHRGRPIPASQKMNTSQLSSWLFEKVYKNPQVFELRELPHDESSRKLLSAYRATFAAIGCTVGGELTFLELARSLYRWYERLPEFSLQTSRVAKDTGLLRAVVNKAQDPIELLTVSLPQLHVQTKTKVPFGDWLTATLSDLGMAHRRLQEAISLEFGQAFEIVGPLGHVRNQLQAECAGQAGDLGDARLKSFILRCTDLSLTDEKWLDSIGSLVVQRPLDAWTDETVGKFSEAMTDLCAQYKRWMRFVMQRGKMPRAAERFVGLTLTMAGGQETSLFFTTSDKSKQLAQSVMEIVSKQTKGNVQLAAAALAQALLDLQGSANNKTEKDEAHGDRKAR